MKSAKWRMGLLAAVAFCACAAPGLADTETVDGVAWTFLTSNGVAVVTQAKPAKGNLVIPPTLGGKSVVRVETNAFHDCGELVSATIPDSVEVIGDWAFSQCTGLKNLVIGNGVTDIRQGAFYACSGLQTLTLPNRVQSIGAFAFEACELKEVFMGEGVTDIGSHAFYECRNLETVHFPPGLRRIGDEAFAHCQNLRGIVLQDGLESIGDHAFYWWTRLRAVVLPDSLKSIGTMAFYDLDGDDFETLALPEAWKDGDGMAILDAAGFASSHLEHSRYYGAMETVDGVLWLYSVTNGAATVAGAIPAEGTVAIPKTLGGYPVKAVGERAFRGCCDMVALEIPNGVTNIGDEACMSCGSLHDVAIPDGVTGIGSWAFSSCYGLETLALPDGVTSIGQGIFYDSAGLREVVLPDSLASVGSNAFATGSMTALRVPEGWRGGANGKQRSSRLDCRCGTMRRESRWTEWSGITLWRTGMRP